jgi:SAM-dependent methyltransferase
MRYRFKKDINYDDPKVRKYVLVRQRRGMWTPEQIDSFAKHFKLKPGMKLLDAGCGYGYSLRTFGHYCLPGGKLTGLDLKDNLLVSARALAIKENLGKCAQFINGDLNRLPFSDNTFDIAMAQIVFCYLDRPEHALDELIRVTKRRGCIAIFDNAVWGGGNSGWNNVFKPTIAEEMMRYEISTRRIKGQFRLGEIDFNVGCYLPGWMEKRGLKNVEARCNEKVHWMAPPYRSPAQKILVRNMKEMLKGIKSKVPASVLASAYKQDKKLLRAGGANDALIRRYFRSTKRRKKQWIEAARKGRISSAYSNGGFWCVWGFKP